MMSQCDSDSAGDDVSATQIPLAMMSQCDSDSAGDDVTVRLRFRWRWCHAVTWILEAAVELFISFGSFFFLFTQLMKSTLPLFLSLCQSVSLSLVYVSLFAFTMVSLSHIFRYVQTQLRTQHTGASRRHPAVSDQIKRVLKHTALSWVMRLHTHKLSETMSSIYTHADMWLSDKVRPDSPSLQEGRPRVSACASWDSDFTR